MVRADPTWFLLKIGYHPDFKDVGPGGILLRGFFEEAARSAIAPRPPRCMLTESAKVPDLNSYPANFRT